MTEAPVDQHFNQHTLVALTTLPLTVLAAVAAVLVVSVALSFRAMQGAAPRVRAVSTSLRVLAALALFALVLEPGTRRSQTERDKNRIIVVADTSASMMNDAPTRLSQAASAWRRGHRSPARTAARRR
jgi:hypothetical protein